MKNLLIIFLVLICGVVSAQGKLSDEKRKEFDAQKIALFTQELELTPEEAAKFWPLYNEMQKKTREIESKMRKGYSEISAAKNLKEENYREAISKMLTYEQDMQNTRKEYYLKMTAVLPASKIWKINEVERKFHRQLFNRLKQEQSEHKK